MYGIALFSSVAVADGEKGILRHLGSCASAGTPDELHHGAWSYVYGPARLVTVHPIVRFLG